MFGSIHSIFHSIYYAPHYRVLHVAVVQDQYREALLRSTTVYVGNLSFYTTEDQIYALFNTVGPVKRVVMGLDRKQKTPCGFCFVEYFARGHT